MSHIQRTTEECETIDTQPLMVSATSVDPQDDENHIKPVSTQEIIHVGKDKENKYTSTKFFPQNRYLPTAENRFLPTAETNVLLALATPHNPHRRKAN